MSVENITEAPIDAVDNKLNTLSEGSENTLRIHEMVSSLDAKETFVFTKLFENVTMKNEKAKKMILAFDQENFS